MVVMDQEVTTQTVLGELDARGVRFLTLRMRSPSLVGCISRLTPADYQTVALDRPGPYNRPKVHEDAAVKLQGYPGTVRQLVVTGLGRPAPTVIITNERDLSRKALITHYVRRMTIEGRLGEIIRAFCADALSSTVNLTVNLDVLAQALLAALRTRLPGYAQATPTPSSVASWRPPARSSPPPTPSPSAWRGAPTHPCSAKPPSPPTPPSPGGETESCASSSPDTAGDWCRMSQFAATRVDAYTQFFGRLEALGTTERESIVHVLLRTLDLAASAEPSDTRRSVVAVACAADLGRADGSQRLAVSTGSRANRIAKTEHATGEALLSNGFLGADVLHVPAGYGFAPHTHPGDHLLFVLGGQGTITTGGRIIETQPGQAYMVDGAVVHAVGATIDHVLLPVGAPHHMIDSETRLEFTVFDDLLADDGSILCEICGVVAWPGAELTQAGCPHFSHQFC